jgi:PAS domain-containing protein
MGKRKDNSTSPNTEMDELQRRLEEAEETLRAIREGEVDALVIDAPQGEVIYTLTGADYPYRLMIDEMNEGAVSVSPDSFILYSNRNFAGILGLNGSSESNASGVPFGDYIVPKCASSFLTTWRKRMSKAFDVSISESRKRQKSAGADVVCQAATETNTIGIIVTDLTAQKALEEKLRQAKEGLEEQVAERTKELRESEARLFGILEHSAADLKAMRRLNEIGTRCAKSGDDVAGCLREILNVAIEISAADKGQHPVARQRFGPAHVCRSEWF